MNNTKSLTFRDITSYTGPLGSSARYTWAHVANQRMPKEFQYSDNMFLGHNGFHVFVTVPPVPGKRKHRMKAKLPCGRTISAGRLMQHGEACDTCKAYFMSL